MISRSTTVSASSDLPSVGRMLQALREYFSCAQFSRGNSQTLTIHNGIVGNSLNIGSQDFRVFGIDHLSGNVHGDRRFFSAELMQESS
jgi:hypothetical protein